MTLKPDHTARLYHLAADMAAELGDAIDDDTAANRRRDTLRHLVDQFHELASEIARATCTPCPGNRPRA